MTGPLTLHIPYRSSSTSHSSPIHPPTHSTKIRSSFPLERVRLRGSRLGHRCSPAARRCVALDDEGEGAVLLILYLQLDLVGDALHLSSRLGLPERLPLSLLELLLLHEGANHAHLLLAVPLKVKAVLLGLPQLHQVVVERLLGDFDLLCGLFKGHLDKLAILHVARVEQAPHADGRDHVGDGPLLNPARPTTKVDPIGRHSPPVLQFTH